MRPCSILKAFLSGDVAKKTRTCPGVHTASNEDPQKGADLDWVVNLEFHFQSLEPALNVFFPLEPDLQIFRMRWGLELRGKKRMAETENRSQVTV